MDSVPLYYTHYTMPPIGASVFTILFRDSPVALAEHFDVQTQLTEAYMY